MIRVLLALAVIFAVIAYRNRPRDFDAYAEPWFA